LYEEAQGEQEVRRGEDPWEGLLDEKYKNSTNVTYVEVYDLLSIPSDRLNRDMQTRLHGIMQSLGFSKNKPIKREGKVLKGWKRSAGREVLSDVNGSKEQVEKDRVSWLAEQEEKLSEKEREAGALVEGSLEWLAEQKEKRISKEIVRLQQEILDLQGKTEENEE
jgi:hypothetical protein